MVDCAFHNYVNVRFVRPVPFYFSPSLSRPVRVEEQQAVVLVFISVIRIFFTC